MAQGRLLVFNLILFALFIINKAVIASNNVQNSHLNEVMSVSTVPVPNAGGDDFQQMLDYLSKTVPKDSNGSSSNSENFDNSTKSPGAPSPGSSYVHSGKEAQNSGSPSASYVQSGKEALVSGSYIKAGSAIAVAIFVGRFFL